MTTNTNTTNDKFVVTNEIDFIVEMSDDTLLTPYKASTIVNGVLESFNLNTVVPQMFYNYTMARIRKGKTPMIKCDDNGKIRFDDLKVWTTKYIAKKLLNS